MGELSLCDHYCLCVRHTERAHDASCESVVSRFSRVAGRAARRGALSAMVALPVLCVASTSRAQAAPPDASDFSTSSTEPEPAVTRSEPDVTLAVVGGTLFGAPYAAGAGYAAFRDGDPRGMDPRYLYVPVIGPLLAIRGIGCDDTGDSSCSTSDGAAVYPLLLLDTVLQATGVVIMIFGLARTEPAPVRHPRRSIRMVPHAAGADRGGASVLATF